MQRADRDLIAQLAQYGVAVSSSALLLQGLHVGLNLGPLAPRGAAGAGAHADGEQLEAHVPPEHRRQVVIHVHGSLMRLRERLRGTLPVHLHA